LEALQSHPERRYAHLAPLPSARGGEAGGGSNATHGDCRKIPRNKVGEEQEVIRTKEEQNVK
jgi:hypothetical protein